MTAARWQTRDDILRWEAQMALEAPLRREQFAFLLDLLLFDSDAPIRCLDLGAGGGALAKVILEARPAASVVLLDGAPAALELAAERLAPFGDRATFVPADLARPAWTAGLDSAFDAVVSSQVLHQFPTARKQALYAEIVGILRPGDWFLNLDHVAIPDATLKERYWRVRMEQLRRLLERERGQPVAFEEVATRAGRSREFSDKPYADLHVQLEWLCGLGLQGVDCFWKWLGLALFGGFKPLTRAIGSGATTGDIELP